MIEVLATGPLTTVQDLGRPGYAALGVGRAGAFDRSALTLGNRLVGNAPGAPGLEVTLGGLAVRLHDAATLALTGAPCPGAPDWGGAVSLPAGTVVRLDPPSTGLRSYLAVRGGFAVAHTLGSASTDTLGGLGPAALSPGDRLPVGPAPHDPVSAAVGPWAGPAHILDVRFGPRDDWFTPAARKGLLRTRWTVGRHADRVGLRLDGPALERARDAELPSEPMVPGALQVPPDGKPILFGPDAPVTGGYPVIAVVGRWDHAAQLRPGDPLRFREVGVGR